MELRHIRYFISVAEHRSISRAARELLIAQPPLSRQIKDLEDELGCALFERSTHGLNLTPEGIAFLSYARQILSLSERSKEYLSEMSKGLRGTIDIASVEGHAPRILSGWIAAFSDRHPQIQYSIWNGSTDDVVSRVGNGLSDFGIITEPYDAEGLFAVPVYREPWMAMIPGDDPLAKELSDTVPIRALEERALIIPSRESRLSEIRQWFPDKGKPLRIRCRVAHMLNAYELTRKGVGIAIYPASDNHFSGDPDVVIKRITEPEVYASYLLVWDRRRQPSRAANLFLREVCGTLNQEMPGSDAGIQEVP